MVGSSEWAAQAEIELDVVPTSESSRAPADAGGFQDIRECGRKRMTRLARPPARVSSGGGLDPAAEAPHQLRRTHAKRWPKRVASSRQAADRNACDNPALSTVEVGTQLVQALEQQGWTIATEPIGPLWLGGTIKAIRDGAELQIDVEQRYVSRAPAGTEIECVLGESLTPDFTLRFETPRGRAAWVLDATLTHDPVLLAEKQKNIWRGCG